MENIAFMLEQFTAVDCRRIAVWIMIMVSSTLFANTELDAPQHPTAVKMELRGEELYSGKFRMIAGDRVSAIITVDNYYPDSGWTTWSQQLYGGYSWRGRFRHTFKGFIVKGYAAGELRGLSEPYYDQIFVLDDEGKRKYISPAKSDITFCYYRDLDGNEICSKETILRDDLDLDPAVYNPGEHGLVKAIDFKLGKGDGVHGQYYWTATVVYRYEYEEAMYYGEEEIGSTSGDLISAGEARDENGTIGSHLLVKDETGRVFFHKDERDYDNIPNWFRYWRDDGAVPQLKSVGFSNAPGYFSKLAVGGEKPVGFLDGNDWGECSNGEIKLHPKAGDAHYYATKVGECQYMRNPVPNDDGFVSKFWDAKEFGIYTCENVIAHETEHRRLLDEYNAEVAGKSVDEIAELDSDMVTENLFVFWGTVIRMGEFEDPMGNRQKTEMCDWLTDKMECETYGDYGVDPHCLDTYSLGYYKQWQYMYYGDNEYLAMNAGYDAVNKHSRVVEANDWAFPGHQSFIPNVFRQGQNMATSPLQQVPSFATTTSSEIEADAFGSMDCKSVDCKLNRAEIGKLYASIQYDFVFDVTGTQRIEMIGYLVDAKTNLIDTACVVHDFTPTNDTINLIFEGQDIYRSGRNGPYKIHSVVFRGRTEYDVPVLYAACVENVPHVNANYEDFVHGEAAILKETVRECATQNGLEIYVDVESQVATNYTLRADYVSPDNCITNTLSANMDCEVGTNCFVLTIPAERIRSMRQNGAFTLVNCRLMLELNASDSVGDLYLTEMTDFESYYGFDDPEDPDAPLSQTIGGYTWYYSVVGEGAVIQKIVDYDYVSWGECAVEPTPTGDIELPSVLGGKKVVAIGESAFEDCSDMTSVTIPSSVTNISKWAFYDCSSLTNLTFVGDAPNVENYAISGVDYWCTVTVYDDATGWDEDEDGYWNDMEIIYRERVTPTDGPSVADDPGATVVGDPTTGFTITPSAGKTDVEVTIPFGVAANKVTVEVGTDVVRIKPNGATVKIKRGADDITSYLVLPVADSSGAIDLSKAAVKAEVVKETLDPTKGAVIMLNATSPTLTTSETKPGLTYTLKEGATIKDMDNGDSKVGDGKAWTPNITVKGGTSGFYSIGVTK